MAISHRSQLVSKAKYSVESQIAGVFTLTENPVSQGGQWLNGETDGIDWKNCQTIANRIYGSSLMPSSSDYSDCIALMTQTLPADQRIVGVFYKAGGYNPAGGIHEAELLIRGSITANDAHFYEVNFAWDGAYTQLVVWHGPHGAGNFTLLDSRAMSAAPNDGDTADVYVNGTVITCKINGSHVAWSPYDTASDSVKWASGKAGCGFFPVTGSGVTLASYGWKSLTPGSAP